MTKKRILLGLDGDFLAMAMNLFSNRDKFEVMLAQDGDEALQGIMQETPDMAILDIGLPEKGGDQCCKKLKRTTLSPETLIVLMVSPDNRGDIGRCLDAQCDAVLVKPLTYEHLSGLVTRLLFAESKTTSRYLVRFPVRYGEDPHNLTENHSIDLTSKGIFVETQKILPVGTLLHVVIALPDSRATTIRCTARVAWVNDPMLRRASLLPHGMGLKFINIDDQQVNAIKEFLYFQEWVLKT